MVASGYKTKSRFIPRERSYCCGKDCLKSNENNVLMFLIPLNKQTIYWGIFVKFGSNIIRSSPPQVFCKKGVLRNFTKFKGKQLCPESLLNKVAACDFIKKETLAQVFSCEFYEISKKTFFPYNTSGGCFCVMFPLKSSRNQWFKWCVT